MSDVDGPVEGANELRREGEAYAVPLLEKLRDIEALKERLIIEDRAGDMLLSSRSIPISVYCGEAADRIEALEAQLEESRGG